MDVYILLGQCDHGDDDELDCIGCSVFASLEAAKETARVNQVEDAGYDIDDPEEAEQYEPFEPLVWEDYDGTSCARANGVRLEIRRLSIDHIITKD